MVQVRRIPISAITSNRFWPKVHRDSNCWLWTAATNKDGYGRFGTTKRVVFAHRYSWELATGETLTKHDTICHTCDVPNCVRNDELGTYQVGRNIYPRRGHLYKATQPVNVADRDLKNRGNWATGPAHGAFTHPESRRKGSLNGNAVLSETDVLTLCERYMAGEHASALATEYGFADHTGIFTILSGASWQHVERPSYAEIKTARARALGPTLNAGPCLDCGTTERRRIAKGLCDRCYSMRNRRARGVQHQSGTDHAQAKLTDDDVRVIRATTGYGTGRELARRFGVAPSLITRIQQRKVWTHL